MNTSGAQPLNGYTRKALHLALCERELLILQDKTGQTKRGSGTLDNARLAELD